MPNWVAPAAHDTSDRRSQATCDSQHLQCPSWWRSESSGGTEVGVRLRASVRLGCVVAVAGLALVACVCGLGCHSNSDHPTNTALAQPGPIFVPRQHNGNYPIRVVCTTGMVADLVRHTGDGHVQVHALMGPGVDPHLYKARPNDVRLLQEADLVFYNGLHLEGKMAELLQSLRHQGKLTFAVTTALTAEDLLPDGGEFDPHVWFNVRLWHKCLELVRDVLMQYDPGHRDDYQRLAEEYGSQLLRLDEWVRQQVQSIPPAQRVLVTAHDAFRYFGQAYGLEVHGIQGISTESEASLSEIDTLAEMLARRKIKAIFVESSVNPRNVQALIEACRRRGHAVRLGGELFSDALGELHQEVPEQDNPGTYVGMIRHNVRTIVEALR
ncbi:Periplasmic zinc-binding protein TroA [bacterium HR36]|nr:Periplasmic zinc-binding protein TroA [bacterium HR36]